MTDLDLQRAQWEGLGTGTRWRGGPCKVTYRAVYQHWGNVWGRKNDLGILGFLQCLMEMETKTASKTVMVRLWAQWEVGRRAFPGAPRTLEPSLLSPTNGLWKPGRTWCYWEQWSLSPFSFLLMFFALFIHQFIEQIPIWGLLNLNARWWYDSETKQFLLSWSLQSIGENWLHSFSQQVFVGWHDQICIFLCKIHLASLWKMDSGRARVRQRNQLGCQS